MPCTSGWSCSPMMTTCRPVASASVTSLWMCRTFGHVALTISAPRACSSSSTSRLSPWERMSTVSPAAASPGDAIRRILALQLRDDIGVVDNAPEHRAAMRLGRFVRERDRTLHAVAEACGLSKNDPHSGAPPTA